VTVEPPASGATLNRVVFVACHGSLNSSAIFTLVGAWLSVMRMLPTPTSSLPDQSYAAPAPCAAPE
jgi:hypothetical protein